MASVKNRDEVHILISEVEQADDPRQAVKLLRDRIAELNAEGKEVPEEFLLIENRFVDECVYASQGR
jgi:hypothetical protein